MKFTKDEKKLIEYTKKKVSEHVKKRKGAGLYDALYAFVLSESGKIYEGTPIECTQQNANCCAERVALANMILNETENAKVSCILTADPVPENSSLKAITLCGACRSALIDYATKNSSILCTSYIRHKNNWTIFERIDKYKPSELYPHPYVPVNWD